ncbi:MAG: hypothetical protein U1A22_01630 [Xanthomonadaceae bacterium]|nr:hypothetical protein [Xanthomonadaceae bacterium]
MSDGKLGHWLAIAASLVVLSTVVAAIAVIGSPSAQRDAKLDHKRVRDLSRIVHAASSYAGHENALPRDLATLAGQPGMRLSIVDPADGSPYTYEVTGDRTFRLCAVFATDTARTADEPWGGDEWSHGAGRHCFDRKTRNTDGQR